MGAGWPLNATATATIRSRSSAKTLRDKPSSSGWVGQFARIRGSVYYRNADTAMKPVFERLAELEIRPEAAQPTVETEDMSLIYELDNLIDDGFPGETVEEDVLDPTDGEQALGDLSAYLARKGGRVSLNEVNCATGPPAGDISALAYASGRRCCRN